MLLKLLLLLHSGSHSAHASTCESLCSKHGASHSCRSRVEWLRSTLGHTIAQALQVVRSDCEGQCSCIPENFIDRQESTSTTQNPNGDCQAGCLLNGASYSCHSRVEWLQSQGSHNLAQALSVVNGQCDSQCSCVASDFPGQHVSTSTTIVVPVAGCEADCVLHGASYSCQSRVEWLENQGSHNLVQALSIVNGQCDGQCSCSSLDFAPSTTTASDESTRRRRGSIDLCDESEWPDKDHNLVCGDCKVLVNQFDTKYFNCDGYCSALGRKCVKAWEEIGDTCTVQYSMTCSQSLKSSDAICECTRTTSTQITTTTSQAPTSSPTEALMPITTQAAPASSTQAPPLGDVTTTSRLGTCSYAHDSIFARSMLQDGVLNQPGSRVMLQGDVQLPFLKIAVGTTLLFDPERPVTLTVGCIMVEGELLIGTATCAHPAPATILLDANSPDPASTCWANAELHVASGGHVRMFGSKGKRLGTSAGYDDQAWTTLLEPVNAGASVLKLNADVKSVGWAVGDEVLVTTTDYDPRLTEVRTISSVSSSELTLDTPLTYYHHGSPMASVADVERAEVALLSRNIRIAAVKPDADSQCAVSDSQREDCGWHGMQEHECQARGCCWQPADPGLPWCFYRRGAQTGGHTIAVSGFGSVVYSAVEFVDLGLEAFGRYPVHFHNAGANHGEALVEFNSIRHSRFRCITVHSTAYVNVAGNVCYDNRGHNIFFEDGPEHSVRLESNLVVGVQPLVNRPPLSEIEELVSDLGLGSNFVSAYWFKNADNVSVRGNVAAGGEGVAFMFAFCAQHKGIADLGATPDLSTHNSQWADFSSNRAHSYEVALWNEALSTSQDMSCRNSQPSIKQSPKFIVDGRTYVDWLVLGDFSMFKIFGRGIWARATRILWNGGSCSDSRNCIETLQGGTWPIREGVISHVTFIGESANKGNTANPSAPDGKYQRTLPDLSGSRVKPANAWGIVVNEGDPNYCFHDSCKGRQTTGGLLYDGPDLFAHCTFIAFRSTKYCAFSPRYSWDNNQHATASELLEPIIEQGTKLSDLICLLPGPGYALWSTPDRLLFSFKVTQDMQTSWVVIDHPFYTADNIGTCITISRASDNPLSQCTGVRFAIGMVGDAWVRNQNGDQLTLYRKGAAVPMKVGGRYTTNSDGETWGLAYDYEGQVYINGRAYGSVPSQGVAYKLQFRDSDIPDDHRCRSSKTCNPAGTSGLCVPFGGGYGLWRPSAEHFDCVCFSGRCCEAGKRCFVAKGTGVGSRRLQLPKRGDWPSSVIEKSTLRRLANQNGAELGTSVGGGAVGALVGVSMVSIFAGIVVLLRRQRLPAVAHPTRAYKVMPMKPMECDAS